MRRACLILVALATAACAKSRDATQVMVRVTSQLTAPAEIDEVLIAVTAANGGAPRVTTVQVSASSAFPVELAVVHAGGPLHGHQAQATGRKGGQEVARATAMLSFEKDRAIQLTLDLARATTDAAAPDSRLPAPDAGSADVPPVVFDAGLDRPGDAEGAGDGPTVDAPTDGPMAFDAAPPEAVEAPGERPADTSPDLGPDAPSCATGCGGCLNRSCGSGAAACACETLCTCQQACQASGDCELRCRDRANCTGTSSAGNGTADFSCTAISRCRFAAAGSSNVSVVCRESSCEVACTDNGNCRVNCDDRAYCTLRCVRSSNCGFTDCKTGYRNCGGGVHTCGLPCP